MEWSDVLSGVMLYWLKLYCVEWGDHVLGKWYYVEWKGMLSEEIWWVKWYCVERSHDFVLSEVIFYWMKWCVKWNYIVWGEVVCWVKWCVEWSDVWREVICWVKWYCVQLSDDVSNKVIFLAGSEVFSEIIFCWVKCYCFEWSDDVLSDVFSEVIFCWVKWCVEWSVIVLGEVMCWVKWYYWVKCCVKWCVDWSGVLSEVTLCRFKWCVEWSDVLCCVKCCV